MTPRVRLRSIAEQDLADLAAHIANDSNDAALRFLDAADRTFELLSSNPTIGASYFSTEPRLAGIRVWRISGFPSGLLPHDNRRG
jgi:plasmid stabilization system protein ParE